MQIVIDIDDNLYTRLFDNGDEYVADMRRACVAIRKGVPLPKGHGRLKDADKIANKVNVLKNNWNRNGNEYESGRYESYDYAIGTINDAPTIIEADKAESEADT